MIEVSAPGDTAPELPQEAMLDPGWALELARSPESDRPRHIEILAERPWWAGCSERAREALSRLWRHAVAVSFAARRLARESGDSDFERVGRAGLLHQVGLWAAAAIEPECLVDLFSRGSPSERRVAEREWLGRELSGLGRDLAERWGCDPLVVDAAWLHADRAGLLSGASEEPERLSLIRSAYALAERTPWALFPDEAYPGNGGDPRVRVLTAEVQVACTGTFLESVRDLREERITRHQASCLLENQRLRAELADRDRLLQALADSNPVEDPTLWSERAGLYWCKEPGVVSARVDWTEAPLGDSTDSKTGRAFRFGKGPGPRAEVRLRFDAAEASIREPNALNRSVWNAWASQVADRSRLSDRLDASLEALRSLVESEEPLRRKALLDSLGEFAAGAGHELNNPLAVILGRAQLLLAASRDPDVSRSLRAIVSQAQRAHRILRDLMYVARPPAPRIRPCQPDDILRASVRDAREEAEARGVRLLVEARDPAPRVWSDPDPLRHIADSFLRNAIEGSVSGGTVQVRGSGDEHSLCWSFQDDGRGMTAREQAHLFDPFFCGRQAGRGLGMGLPRAARSIELIGGQLRWQSAPGRGSLFQITLPLATEDPVEPTGPGEPAALG